MSVLHQSMCIFKAALSSLSDGLAKYFKPVWTAVYRFWVHLKLGKKRFVKVNIDISCKYFSFLVYQRSVQLLYETIGTLIEALTAFTVR